MSQLIISGAPVFVTINGQQQGLISAECLSYGSAKYYHRNEDQIVVTAIDHDLSKTKPPARQTLSFSKIIDKSTPLLAKAIYSGEKLHIIFDFYRACGYGNLERMYAIELTDAMIEKITMLYSPASSNKSPEEMILLSYENIVWHHLG